MCTAVRGPSSNDPHSRHACHRHRGTGQNRTPDFSDYPDRGNTPRRLHRHSAVPRRRTTGFTQKLPEIHSHHTAVHNTGAPPAPPPPHRGSQGWGNHAPENGPPARRANLGEETREASPDCVPRSGDPAATIRIHVTFATDAAVPARSEHQASRTPPTEETRQRAFTDTRQYRGVGLPGSHKNSPKSTLTTPRYTTRGHLLRYRRDSNTWTSRITPTGEIHQRTFTDTRQYRGVGQPGSHTNSPKSMLTTPRYTTRGTYRATSATQHGGTSRATSPLQLCPRFSYVGASAFAYFEGRRTHIAEGGRLSRRGPGRRPAGARGAGRPRRRGRCPPGRRSRIRRTWSRGRTRPRARP